MRDRYDDEGPFLPEGPRFPGTVYAAGVTWIIFGCLILINAVVNLGMSLSGVAGAPPQAPGGGAGQAAGGTCGAIFAALFGAAFLFVGVQSTQGKARDTLGNGIGSIIIGLLNGGAGTVMAIAGLALGGTGGLLLLVMGGISILGGLGLLVAGVLALAGREPYLAWRRAQERSRIDPAER
jgi:hypothetical protein